MIDRLKITHHENTPPIFNLSGFLTKKTLPTLVVNIQRCMPFILDLEDLEGMDDSSVRALSDLSNMCTFVVWNADDSVKRRLVGEGIKADFLPEETI